MLDLPRYLGSTIGIEDLTLKDYIFLHDVMVKAVQCKVIFFTALMAIVRREASL